MIPRESVNEQTPMLAAGIALIVVTAVAMYVVLPAYRDWATFSKDIADMRSITEGPNIDAQMATTEEKTQRLLLQLDSLLGQEPGNTGAPALMGQIQELATASNLELQAITPGDSDATAGITEAEYRIELAGDYFTLATWLAELTTALPQLGIRQFVFRPVDDKTDGQLLKLELTVLAYGREP